MAKRNVEATNDSFVREVAAKGMAKFKPSDNRSGQGTGSVLPDEVTRFHKGLKDPRFVSLDPEGKE